MLEIYIVTINFKVLVYIDTFNNLENLIIFKRLHILSYLLRLSSKMNVIYHQNRMIVVEDMFHKLNRV